MMRSYSARGRPGGAASRAISARMYSAALTPCDDMNSYCDSGRRTDKVTIRSPYISSSDLRPAPSRLPPCLGIGIILPRDTLNQVAILKDGAIIQLDVNKLTGSRNGQSPQEAPSGVVGSAIMRVPQPATPEGVFCIMDKNDKKRFWAQVNKSGPLHPRLGTRCWDWVGAKYQQGYGSFSIAGKSRKAHRIVYKLTNGTIPDGMSICHRCDRKQCVNPDHLFAGTHKQNMHDMFDKGRGVLNLDNLKHRRGEKHHSAKITTDDVREIRDRYGSGETQVKLANEFDLSQAQVGRIVRRERWAHID